MTARPPISPALESAPAAKAPITLARNSTIYPPPHLASASLCNRRQLPTPYLSQVRTHRPAGVDTRASRAMQSVSERTIEIVGACVWLRYYSDTAKISEYQRKGGKAMLPLIGLAATFVPEIIQLIAGDKAVTVATTVTDAVAQIAGTADPVVAKQKLDSDP